MIRHQTASMVVVDPAKASVLLVWHNASHLWLFPGGHVDDGETPAQAAVREVLEETGVHAYLCSGDPFDTASYPAPAKPDRPGKPAEAAHTHDDVLFLGVADSTLPSAAKVDEVAQVRWVPVAEVAGMNVRDEVPAMAEAALKAVTR